VSEAFPIDYFASRAAFRERGARAGATLREHPIEARGPGGETLGIDTAWIGPPRPRRLLAVCSGTHGNEGLAGSAAQLQLLGDLDVLCAPHGGSLPDGTSILLVHANNPWGMAWRRRQNEDNVDLNRNFVDWSRPRPDRPEYAALAPLLCPDELSDAGEAAFREAAYALVERHGIAWVQARFTEGQYQQPDGLYYGGGGPTASNRLLRSIFAEALEGVDEALIIDVHTGMGAYGDWIAIAGSGDGDPASEWLARAYAPGRLQLIYGSGGADHGGRWPEVSGKFTTAIAADNPRCAVRGFSCEFGTYDGERVFLAERREQWLHRRGDRSSEQGRAILAELDECMLPADPAWRRLVLAGARGCILDGWRALAGEGRAR